MQNDTIPSNLLISACPCCGTRLMSGTLLIGGLLQCARCKRFWLVEMDAATYSVTVKKSPTAISKAADRL